ncbi:MAG: MFS transporter [Candidatus Melainabacteria bacterium]|nr:MFS transporter [Candidatus Melainabacteria bacterium]
MTLLLKTAQVTQQRKTNFRWVVMALAFLITMVNYLDRSAISYAINPIKKEFGLNDADFGFIAAAFGIGYMVMTVGGGILVDKWGSRKVWSLAAIAWSGITACLGLASGFWTLFAMRTLLGIAEGPHFPALTRVVTDWLPISERARATAFGLAAVPLASVVGAPLISSLVTTMGWKVMFAVLGTLGIIWSIVWFVLFRDSPENSQFVLTDELTHIRRQLPNTPNHPNRQIHQYMPNTGKTTWKYMLTNRALLANNYAFFAFGYLLFFALTWLPGYLESVYSIELKHIGWFLVAPWLTAAVLLVWAGHLSDWLWLKTGSMRVARSHLIWICQLASAACFVPVLFTNSLPTAMIAISFGVGLGLMPNAAFYALNSDLAGDRAATSLGIMDCFFAASGIAAPALTGVLANATGNFNAAFGLLIFFAITSAVGIILFQHPDHKV